MATGRRIRLELAAIAAALGAAAPGLAGEPAGSGFPLPLASVPPTTTEGGKAAIYTPPPVAPAPAETEQCPPALPCGARLIGTVQKNGAVELQVPAWRW